MMLNSYINISDITKAIKIVLTISGKLRLEIYAHKLSVALTLI